MMSKLTLKPRSSVLLVVDMQDFFLHENSHAYVQNKKRIIKNIKKLIKSYKTKNLPIIFTRHIGSNNSLANKWWSRPLFKKNPFSKLSSELINLVKDYKNYFIIEKPEYDAFYNTNLDNLLKKLRISQIVISGVATHLCCETTVRSAFCRGFEVFIPKDGTESFKKKYKDASLLNLAHGFAVIVNSVKEICETLNDL
ncbi:cysteine hydrolase [Pseudomonadota bacterium]